MRKQTVLLLIVCCGLVLALGEQNKPTPPLIQVPPALQNKTVIPPPQTKPGMPPQNQPPTRPGQPGNQQAQDEQNKAVVRHVFDELFSQGRYEFIDQVYARDCRVHHRGNMYSLDEAVTEGKGWRSAAPDLRMLTEQMTVQGNLVTVNWMAQGTNTGRGNGLLKPTGKRILIRGRSMFRVVNGKIAEVWNEYDRDEIFRQLGVNPKVGRLFDASQAVWLSVNRFFTGTQESAGLVEAGD
jgi:predicted ester cyclase